MSKYLLFVVIGIILYLLWNSNDSFSVGVPTASCGVLGQPLQNTISVKLLSNENKDFCNRGVANDNCTITDRYSYIQNCYNDCAKLSNDRDIENCRRMNRTSSCWQMCDFNEIKDYSMAIDVTPYRFGFSKINQLVDVFDEIFMQYVATLNSNDPNFSFTLDNTVNQLSFSEYKLKQYLEKTNNDKCIKYIKQGIFYCNGKVYYYIATFSNARVSHSLDTPEYNTRISADGLSEKYHFVNNEITPPSIPFIHLDFSNIDNDTENISILNEHRIQLSENCQQAQQYNTYQEFFLDINPTYRGGEFTTFLDTDIADETQLQTETTYNGLPDIRNTFDTKLDIIDSRDTKTFNIWLLLNASDDDKTLAFFNANRYISPENSIDDLLRQITDITNSDSFNSLYGHDVPLPNVKRLGNDLYTFSMEAGSALLFNPIETSHTGFTPDSGIRISVESRYLLLPFNFDLEDVFEIPRLSTVSRLSVKKNFVNTPNVIPAYFPLTIYTWFQTEFQFILPIYDRLKGQGTIHQDILSRAANRGNISVEIFKMILDNVPYHKYMDNTRKEASIQEYLVTGQ